MITIALARRSIRNSVPGVQTANPRPSLPGDHLGGDDHQPRQPRGHPERRNHLRRNGRQRDLAEQTRPLDAEIAGHSKEDAGMFATAAAVEKTIGKNAAMKMRKIAGASPMPSHRIANGIHASGDRLLKKLMSGSSASRARRE